MQLAHHGRDKALVEEPLGLHPSRCSLCSPNFAQVSEQHSVASDSAEGARLCLTLRPAGSTEGGPKL